MIMKRRLFILGIIGIIVVGLFFIITSDMNDENVERNNVLLTGETKQFDITATNWDLHLL